MQIIYLALKKPLQLEEAFLKNFESFIEPIIYLISIIALFKILESATFNT